MLSVRITMNSFWRQGWTHSSGQKKDRKEPNKRLLGKIGEGDRRIIGIDEQGAGEKTLTQHTKNSQVLEPSCDDNRSSHPKLNTTRPDSHGQKECKQQQNAAHRSESESHTHLGNEYTATAPQVQCDPKLFFNP